MSWLTQVFKFPRLAGDLRRITSGGGPRRVRLLGVRRPSGLIIPSSTVNLEIEAKDGTKTRLEPEIPVPFLYAWAYRLSRRLGVPVISSRDPENLELSMTLPRRNG
jgi:hypothetical protein